MGIQWEFNGSSMGVQLEFNGNSMGVQWEFNGSSMGVQWEFNSLQNQGKVISIAQNVETQNFAS
mgnify:CR=1 FL=1